MAKTQSYHYPRRPNHASVNRRFKRGRNTGDRTGDVRKQDHREVVMRVFVECHDRKARR